MEEVGATGPKRKNACGLGILKIGYARLAIHPEHSHGARFGLDTMQKEATAMRVSDTLRRQGDVQPEKTEGSGLEKGKLSEKGDGFIL
jgi:hypothetical protein